MSTISTVSSGIDSYYLQETSIAQSTEEETTTPQEEETSIASASANSGDQLVISDEAASLYSKYSKPQKEEAPKKRMAKAEIQTFVNR